MTAAHQRIEVSHAFLFPHGNPLAVYGIVIGLGGVAVQDANRFRELRRFEFGQHLGEGGVGALAHLARGTEHGHGPVRGDAHEGVEVGGVVEGGDGARRGRKSREQRGRPRRTGDAPRGVMRVDLEGHGERVVGAGCEQR